MRNVLRCFSSFLILAAFSYGSMAMEADEARQKIAALNDCEQDSECIILKDHACGWDIIGTRHQQAYDELIQYTPWKSCLTGAKKPAGAQCINATCHAKE